MIILLFIDRTEDAPVHSHETFQSVDHMRETLLDDESYGFEAEELDELIAAKALYRDKRDIFQIIELENVA